jgi:hypothetical protein
MFKQLTVAGFMAAAAFTAMAAAPATAQEDRHVKIINTTQTTMREFYASNVNRTNWEEDILGQDVLPPGQSVTINIDDGSGMCLYDFKAVFTDGDVVIRNRINVCQISEYRYTGN